MRSKIKGRKELARIVEDFKKQGIKVVFTNGCFDLLHVGHVRYLEEARTLGDLLIVGINSDRSVRGLKGPTRPVLPVDERAEILSGLGCVDFITVFDEATPLELISLLRPHVLVKGGDWTAEEVVGREVVEGVGGRVVLLPFSPGSSTSSIIESILKGHEKKI